MNTLHKSLLYLSGAILTIAIAYLLYTAPFMAGASAPSGIPATVATTSPALVNTSASTVFATSTCASRTISTVASPIMITFSDVQGSVPTGTFGHLQAASTTVAYDSGLYGCGALKVYSFVSSTITVMESR